MQSKSSPKGSMINQLGSICGAVVRMKSLITNLTWGQKCDKNKFHAIETNQNVRIGRPQVCTRLDFLELRRAQWPAASLKKNL